MFVVYNTFAQQPVTINLHHDGVTPTAFASDARLSSFFDLLSTNVDRKGSPFVSTIEGKSVPVYGAQWHAERNQVRLSGLFAAVFIWICSRYLPCFFACWPCFRTNL